MFIDIECGSLVVCLHPQGFVWLQPMYTEESWCCPVHLRPDGEYC